MSDLIVAAVGDSVVWGQGLDLADKFVSVASRRIAEKLNKRHRIEAFVAHSGAKITGDRESTQKFLDKFPLLFQNEQLRQDLRNGNEHLAERLPGEVNRTYPTIMFQIEKLVPPSIGKITDLLIIDGGANDVDFQEVLNPMDFPDDLRKSDLESRLKQVFYVGMKDLLITARARFPQAVIVVTGYYSAFSDDSDISEIVDFMLAEDGRGWFEEYFVEKPGALGAVAGMVLFGPAGAIAGYLGDLFGGDGVRDEVQNLAKKMVAKSKYGHTRSLYWIRKAIVELSENSRIRDPGIIFAHPGFAPENALFASGRTFVHERYRIRNVEDPVKDTRKQDCEANIPNEDLRTNCIRASFIHPNEHGAAQYSARIADRYDDLRQLGSARALLSRVVGESRGEAVSIKEALGRHGISLQFGLRACLQFTFIDVIAVTIRTGSNSEADIEDDIYLDLGGGRWQLTKLTTRDFEPGTTAQFTIDTLGQLRLTDITKAELYRLASDREDRPGLKWQPSWIKIEFNGRTVFESRNLGSVESGKSLKLAYPT